MSSAMNAASSKKLTTKIAIELKQASKKALYKTTTHALQLGVLRGLHFQKTKPQGKLVSVSQGAVFDVAVDIDPDSATFKQWVGVHLSGENHIQFYVPPGYAHGFLVLSEIADFQYKCTELYNPDDEGGIHWDDKEIAIQWPTSEQLLVSQKDAALPTLSDYLEN